MPTFSSTQNTTPFNPSANQSGITRINNNQINYSAIFANQKIQTGTVTGDLFAPLVITQSDWVIAGNLTVQGASTYLTIASTNTYVNDPLIVLNNAYSGTPNRDIGLVFNRSTTNSSNPAFIWQESGGEFQLKVTSENGFYGNGNSTSINTTSYSNVRVGNLFTVYGLSVGTNLQTTGNLLVQNNGSFANIWTGSPTFDFIPLATSANIGSTTGTLTLNNQNINTGQTSQLNLVNNTQFTGTLNFANSPATVNAWQAASGITIGAVGSTNFTSIRSGNIYLPGATLINFAGGSFQELNTPSTGTLNVFNANVATVNAFGAATGLTIGNNGTALTNFLNFRGGNVYLPNTSRVELDGGAFQEVLSSSTGSLNLFNANLTIANAFGTSNVTIGSTSAFGFTSLRSGNIYLPNATRLEMDGGPFQEVLSSSTGSINVFNANITLANIFGAATNQVTIGPSAGTGTLLLNHATIQTSVTSGTLALFNTGLTGTLNAAGAATTITLGNTTNSAQTISIGSSTTAAQTVNVADGVTGSSSTKTVNLGLNGASGSTTNLNMGSSSGGTTTINSPTVTLSAATTTNINGTNPVVATTSTGTLTLFNTNLVETLAFGSANITVGSPVAGSYANIRAALISFPSASNVDTGASSLSFANVSPTAVNAFGAATRLVLGSASGTAVTVLRSPTVIQESTQGTQANLYNSGTTYLNLAGAATYVNIGAQTGNTQINNPTLNLNPAGSATTAIVVNGVNATVANTNATYVEAFGSASTLSFATTTGSTNIRNALNVGGVVNFNNNADATAFSGSNPALQVTGGLAVTKQTWLQGNVTIGGNLIIQGNITSFSSNNLSVQDAIIDLHYLQGTSGVLSSDDGKDIGLRFHFYKTTNDNAALIWANDSGALEFYGNAVTESATTKVSGNYGNIKIGNLLVTSGGSDAGFLTGTVSTSPSTGAIVIQNSGGLGVGGNIWLSGNIDTNSTTVPFGAFNGSAQTVEAFKSATTLIIGATSGAANIQNTTVNLPNAVTLNINGASPSIVTSSTGTASVFNTNALVGQLFGAATSGVTIAASSTALTNFLNFRGGNVYLPNASRLEMDGGAFQEVVSSSTGTLNLFNANVATINAFGAATGLTVGFSGTALTNFLNFRGGNVYLPNASRIDLNGQPFAELVTSSTGSLNLFNANLTIANAFGTSNVTIGSTSAFGFTSLRSGNIYLPNANRLEMDGGAFQEVLSSSTGTLNLFNANVTTVNAFGAATAINIGNQTSSYANIRSSIINFSSAANIAFSSSPAPLNFGNTAAAAVWMWGNTSTLNIGSQAGAGTTIIQNALVSKGNVYANSAATIPTIGTNSYTAGGALVVNGAAGIGGNLVVGTQANIQAQAISSSFQTGSLVTMGGIGSAGNINIKGNLQLAVGNEIPGVVNLPQILAQFSSTVNSYAQVNMQNVNNGTQATSDFIATSNAGTDTTLFIDLGITGSNYDNTSPNNSLGTSINKNDGYLYVQGGATGAVAGGNLVIGTVVPDRTTQIIAGGINQNNVAMTINQTNINHPWSTAATSPTTGAFTVKGGAGFQRNVFVANSISINSNQTAENTIIGTVNRPTFVKIDSGNNSVAFGNGTSSLYCVTAFDTVDAIKLPTGDNSGRPSALANDNSNTLGLDRTGMLRFNTNLGSSGGELEFFDSQGHWRTPGTVAITPYTNRTYVVATGNQYGNVDGVNTQFILPANVSTTGAIIAVNGVQQLPGYSYTVINANVAQVAQFGGTSVSVLKFYEAPALNDVVSATIVTTTTSVTSISSANGYQQYITDENLGLFLYTGSNNNYLRLNLDQNGVLNFSQGTSIAYNPGPGGNITVNVNAPQLIDSWSQSTYRTAKYIIQAQNGTTAFQAMEALVMTDGQNNAYITTYGVIVNGATDLGNISANVVAGNVSVWFNSPTLTNSNVKAFATYISA